MIPQDLRSRRIQSDTLDIGGATIRLFGIFILSFAIWSLAAAALSLSQQAWPRISEYRSAP